MYMNHWPCKYGIGSPFFAARVTAYLTLTTIGRVLALEQQHQPMFLTLPSLTSLRKPDIKYFHGSVYSADFPSR